MWQDTMKFELFFSLKMLEQLGDFTKLVSKAEIQGFKESLLNLNDEELRGEGVTREQVNKIIKDSEELTKMQDLHVFFFKKSC